MNVLDTNIWICLHGQVTILYSEDFEGLGPIDGLTIVNPFV